MAITNVKAKVDTIAILMLENRSYDHMLSSLSLNIGPNPRSDIDGITSLLKKQYASESATKIYRPWITNDEPQVADLPHGRRLVSVQLRGTETETDPIGMDGFVEAYRLESGVSVVPQPAAPLAIQNRPWMIDYFAAQHTVCSRWFSPLPTDTQPNRLMALSGNTKYDNTRPRVITQKPLVYHWLDERQIRWRVYRSGLPFEMLISTMWDEIFDSDLFRSVKELSDDVINEPDDSFPHVIFIEPAFGDSPIELGYQANDDHPPRQIGPGQQFMREMYMALAANPDRWAKTVMIVTYDEHGGFYDHVEPMRVTTNPPLDAEWIGGAFATTGVRVPGIVASPLATGGFVHDRPLDHTSILQFIASVFGENGETYSAEVDDRRAQGIGNITDVLSDDPPRTGIPSPPDKAPPVVPLGPAVKHERPVEEIQPRKGENAKAFEDAAIQILENRPREEIKARYPELIHWENTRP